MTLFLELDDDNYGISTDWIKVPLTFRILKGSNGFGNVIASPYPRVLWLNQNWDLATIHKKIFNFLRFFFDYKNEEFSKLDNDEAFATAFEDLSEENWQEKLTNSNYAYYLHCGTSLNPNGIFVIENLGITTSYKTDPVPFTESITIAAFIEEYLFKCQKDNEANAQEELKNKIATFELEVIWTRNRNLNCDLKYSRCKKHQYYDKIEEEIKNMNGQEIQIETLFEAFQSDKIYSHKKIMYGKICNYHIDAFEK